MKLVYIKDNEGFARKKPINKVLENEIIITEEEYKKITGYEIMLELTKRGGKREGSGRKKLYICRKKATFDLDETDIISLKEYAKKHKISKNKAISEAIHYLTRNEA
ncbi:MAG TPA: hypothetical protein DDW90_08070 [Cyanobacteria bacterium UBA9971]|nr:hypothetical protein [Cyanobacteria bacterium UBA9971]